MLKARRAIVALCVVAILAVLGLLMRGRSPQPVAASMVTPSTPTTVHSVAQQPPAVTSPAAKDDNTIAVCGHGRVAIDKEDPLAESRRVGEFTRDTGARWLSALQDSGDLRARVAGLLLEGKVTGGGSIRPVAEQTRDAVVQLAAGASDPAVYAIALSMCDTDSDAGADVACQRLSVRTWARMDSDNAAPWLLLARRAHGAKDSAAEAEAFGEAARAHHFDLYSNSLYAFAESRLPQDATPLQRAFLATEALGIETSIAPPIYAYASRHCSTDAMQSGEIRQQCSSLAELLASKATTLLELNLGQIIGARAGWSGRRVAELRHEQHALMQALMQATPTDNDELWTCDGVSRRNAYFAQRARLGEIGAARDALERSGESIEDMDLKYTEFRDKIVREAQEHERSSPNESAQDPGHDSQPGTTAAP